MRLRLAPAVAALALACARCAAAVRVADVALWEAAGGAVAVASRVDGEGATLSAVTAWYALNFETTARNATMSRGSDGRWTATLSGLAAGALLRLNVTATASGGASASASAAPALVAPSVVNAESRLPTLHWFVADAEGARWDAAVPCEVFFDAGDGSGLIYHAHVSTHRTGSERKDPKANLWARGKSKDWPKRNYKLSFHGGHHGGNGTSSGNGMRLFRWRRDLPPAKAVELHSMYQESGPVSYIRKALALRFMEALGVPAAAARHVRVRQNGVFFGLYLMVEQVDEIFLARKGFAPEGRMFKAAHWKYSNLRLPDLSLQCPFGTPDQDWWPRGAAGTTCPMIVFSEASHGHQAGPAAGGPPSAPHEREIADLALAVARGDLSGFASLDAVVLEMAAQTAMLHHDRCTKNRFYYRAPPERGGKWAVIPYDMKDSFATDNRGNGRDCAALGTPCSNAESYCLLSCPDFNSIFFCDSSHPQDTFPESDGRSTYNHLVDAVLRNATLRAQYLAKLRWIADTYLSTGWLQRTVGELREAVAASARADNAIWHAGDIDVGVSALLAQMTTRRAQIYSQLAQAGPAPAQARAQALPEATSAADAPAQASQARVVGTSSAAPGPAQQPHDAGRASSSSSSTSDASAGSADKDFASSSDADAAGAPGPAAAQGALL